MWPFVPTDRRILDLRRKLQGMTAVATQLRTEKAKAEEANKTLRRLVDIGMSVRDSALSERDAAKALLAARDADLARANSYASELEEALRQRDADHAEVSGRLQDALDRLALVDREEDMRVEVRAKRASDGQGDE